MKQSFYYNGTILTMEGHSPHYVESVLVEDGVILAAAEQNLLERELKKNARMVNLQGKAMLPGLIDVNARPAAAVCRALERDASRQEKTVGLLKFVRMLGESISRYTACGITTLQEVLCGEKEFQLLKLAGMFGRLPVDVACCFRLEASKQNLPVQNPALNLHRMHLRRAGCIASEEIFADREDLKEWMRLCVQNRWQLTVPVRDETEIACFLDCYEEILTEDEELDNTLPRPVLTNVRGIYRDQLKRCRELGVMTEYGIERLRRLGDKSFAEVYGPEQTERICPLRSAVWTGLPIVIYPEEAQRVHMLSCVHQAVNRTTDGGHILGMQERLSPYEALRAVTIHAACRLFEEEHKGSIRAGKDADFVILDQDPLQAAPEKIDTVKVLETIKRDQSVFRL